MFIIVEGIDGSGKSGLITSLANYYSNYTVADIRQQWEKVDKKNVDSRKQFFIDYFENNKNKNLLIDRFHLSEVVYGITLKRNEIDLFEFEKQIFGNDISKVILIVVDVHETDALKRIKARDGKDELQNLAIDRNTFSSKFQDSEIPRKLFIYNSKFEKLEEYVKDYIESHCGVVGKTLGK